MVAADLVTTALAVGVVVLCVTTALSAFALPVPWRQRRPRPASSFPVIERRVVTGPPARAPLALPPAPRQAPGSPDVPSAGLRDAESLVEQLLERDPGRLAELLTRWINADDEPGSATT